MNRHDDDLDDEIRFHLDTEAELQRERGLNPAEASAAARKAFGNVGQVQEVTRQMRIWTSLERLSQDTRYALRSLRHSPAFAITAVISLGLGIGANIAAFSVADAILFRPLPIERPLGVVAINGQTAQNRLEGISYPDLRDLRERSRLFSGITGYTLARFAFSMTREDVPQMRMGMQVSQGFFETLGLRPVLGRAFTDEETRIPGRDAVAVITNDFWREQFNGNPVVVGSTVRLNGIPFTIVGVTPESFTGMDPLIRPAVIVPFTMSPRLGAGKESILEKRGQPALNLRARLKPGVSVQQAQAELAAVARGLEQQYPEIHRGRTLRARSELQLRFAQSPPAAVVAILLVVLSMLVLAIACANVASLLLARGRSRMREVVIRLAIGAGRARLVQQFLTESLVVALMGGLAGLGLAWVSIEYLAAVRLPTDTPMALGVQLDGRVLLFALAASAASALLFGLAPALRSTKQDVSPVLKSGGADSAGRARSLGRSALVAAQVALSLVLLVTSATLLEAFRRMLIADPGLRTDHLMMFEFDPGMVGYSEEQAAAFFRQLSDRARQIPGVRSATLSRAVPFRPNFTDLSVVPEGYALPANQTSVTVAANIVDASYFETAGTALVRGRAFTTSDTSTSRAVAIVNEEFAARYWADRDAVGRRFRATVDGPYIEVVGVARNGKYLSLTETPQPYVYLPFAQNARSRMTLLVRTEGAPAGITDPVLRAVHEIDPNQPVYNVRPFETYYEGGALGPALVVIQMVGSTGVVGLALAMVGLYGLIAYSVARRTREIGIRMAVGASRGAVLGMVLRQGLTLAGTGALVGLVMSVPVFRVLAAGLAGVGELSRWTLVLAPVGMLVVTGLACAVPAWRACRIDAAVALRD